MKIQMYTIKDWKGNFPFNGMEGKYQKDKVRKKNIYFFIAPERNIAGVFKVKRKGDRISVVIKDTARFINKKQKSLEMGKLWE